MRRQLTIARRRMSNQMEAAARAGPALDSTDQPVAHHRCVLRALIHTCECTASNARRIAIATIEVAPGPGPDPMEIVRDPDPSRDAMMMFANTGTASASPAPKDLNQVSSTEI